MKKLAIALLLSATFYSSFAQQKNVDSLLYQAYTAIKNNDQSSFVKLFIDYKQFQSLLSESVKKNGNRAVQAMPMPDFSEKDFNEQVRKQDEKQFIVFMSKVLSKGIHPIQLKFDGCQYEENIPKGFDDQRVVTGLLFVNDNKENYRIPFSVTWLETQKGWYAMSLRDILRKDEKEKRLAPDSVVSDTVLVEIVQEVEQRPPPPPPPPSKKKAAKIKSTARKTKVTS